MLTPSQFAATNDMRGRMIVLPLPKINEVTHGTIRGSTNIEQPLATFSVSRSDKTAVSFRRLATLLPHMY